jgi:hypothetical protein
MQQASLETHSPFILTWNMTKIQLIQTRLVFWIATHCPNENSTPFTPDGEQ